MGMMDTRGTYLRNIDAGVTVLVCSRETEQFVLGGDSILVPANFDLLARGIKFGFTHLVRQMKSNDLVSDHVLSRSEIVWKVGGVSVPAHFVWA